MLLSRHGISNKTVLKIYKISVLFFPASFSLTLLVPQSSHLHFHKVIFCRLYCVLYTFVILKSSSLLSQHSLRESSATNLNFYALMGKICIGFKVCISLCVIFSVLWSVSKIITFMVMSMFRRLQ